MFRSASIVLSIMVMSGCASSVRAEGSDLVSRAVQSMTPGYEKRSGGHVISSEFLPFESSVAGTIKWKSTWRGRGGCGVMTKVLAEFPAGWVFMLTVAPDNNELARRVLATLSATSDDPECY